jgi:hypothetical protein
MDLRPDVVTVAVTRVDGGVTVMRVIKTSYRKPAEGEGTERVAYRVVDVTPEYIDRQISRHVEGGNWVGPYAPVSWEIVPNDYINDDTDHTYRDAWKYEGKTKPGHDMVKARNIHRAQLRNRRGNMLDALDAEYMKADEAGDSQAKKSVATKRQKLRDVTEHPSIEAAQTVEELKACTIQSLTGQ